MLILVSKAYAQLIHFDLYLALGNFAALQTRVRSCRVQPKPILAKSIEAVCHAVNIACVCYPKQVLCLQRSAATTCLLRHHGFPAELVIGAQQMPFRAHAWVELCGQIVNDKSYTSEIYAVLDRC
jgi:hypothetical protein